MKTLNVMADLETLGVDATSVVLSIALVPFGAGWISTDRFVYRPKVEDQLKAGATITESTLFWWLTQSNDVRLAEADAVRTDSSIVARQIISDLLFVFEGDCSVVLWGNGASFDNVILREFFNRCGILPPWSGRDNLCYRTIKRLYPKLTDDEVKPCELAHDPYEDAMYQVRYLQALANKHEDLRRLLND